MRTDQFIDLLKIIFKWVLQLTFLLVNFLSSSNRLRATRPRNFWPGFFRPGEKLNFEPGTRPGPGIQLIEWSSSMKKMIISGNSRMTAKFRPRRVNFNESVFLELFLLGEIAAAPKSFKQKNSENVFKFSPSSIFASEVTIIFQVFFVSLSFVWKILGLLYVSGFSKPNVLFNYFVILTRNTFCFQLNIIGLILKTLKISRYKTIHVMLILVIKPFNFDL